MFIVKTAIELYHDRQAMSPSLHELKKEIFAKLDAIAGKKITTLNEIMAEKEREERLEVVRLEKERVQTLRHAQAERERLPFLRPGKTTFTSSNDGSNIKTKKKPVEEKPFKAGVKPEDELKFTLDDL